PTSPSSPPDPTPLSLHDALPISPDERPANASARKCRGIGRRATAAGPRGGWREPRAACVMDQRANLPRHPSSEELADLRRRLAETCVHGAEVLEQTARLADELA